MMGYQIDMKNVCYTSRTHSHKVLNNISLTITQGSFVAVVGSNAAGKSSLLKAIAGELTLNSGEVKIGGRVIDKPVNRKIDGVGIVHQDESTDLIEHVSVAQNIAIRQICCKGHPCKIWSNSEKWKRDISSKLASIKGFSPPDLDQKVKYLSGGVKQQLNVAIAIHLEHNNTPSRLLLLDEHTSKLDTTNASTIMDFTAYEIKSNGITALMVTHRLSDAIKYTDRILIMLNGTLAEDINNDGSITVQDLEAKIRSK